MKLRPGIDRERKRYVHSLTERSYIYFCFFLLYNFGALLAVLLYVFGPRAHPRPTCHARVERRAESVPMVRPRGRGPPEGSVWTARAGGVLLCVRCVHMGRALRGPAPGPATNMMKLLWLVMTCLKLVPD